MPLILAVDTSATPVSCALVRDGKVLASYFAQTGMTHSQTLMPMVESALHTAGVAVRDVDALAVNAGPGSFTGVRIGVSAVKGLAFAESKPCVSVSTLAAMAENFRGLPTDAVIHCVMDARCQQVYTASFTVDGDGKVRRETTDEAISVAELTKREKNRKICHIFVGDGAVLCYNAFDMQNIPARLAPPLMRMQNAVGTALIAEREYIAGNTVSAAELSPVYLRLPQAERELRARLAGENK